MRRLHVGGEPTPHTRVALAEDLTDTLHGTLPHQGCGDCLKLLREMLDASLSGRCETVDLPIVPKTPSRQPTNDHALLVEEVKMPALQRFDTAMKAHMGHGSATLLR
jgi:hypothetical protein